MLYQGGDDSKNKLMEEDQKISKYNSAFAQLQRIDQLWSDCHKHSRQGNYAAWNNDLDKIYSELTRDYKEGSSDDKDVTLKHLSFIKKLGEIGAFSNKISGFKDNKDYNIASKYYYVLLEKEIWLGRLQNELGKGTKWEDADDEETE